AQLLDTAQTEYVRQVELASRFGELRGKLHLSCRRIVVANDARRLPLGEDADLDAALVRQDARDRVAQHTALQTEVAHGGGRRLLDARKVVSMRLKEVDHLVERRVVEVKGRIRVVPVAL